MSDRMKISRKKAANLTNPMLTSPDKSMSDHLQHGFGSLSSSAASKNTAIASHEISRISLRPQGRLTVSEPGDFYEQEADRVADMVMRMQAPEPQINLSQISSQSSIQRKCTACEREEEEQIQRKPSQLQALAEGSIETSSNLESQLRATQGGGSPLAENIRVFMEPRFGTDFSSVRVHTGKVAEQMNQDLRAQAFTYGSNIYFGAGKFPGNNNLTAHELTHVVQQTGGVQTKQLTNQPILQPLFEISSAPGIIQQREVCDDSGACWEEAEAAQTTSEQVYTPISANEQTYNPATGGYPSETPTQGSENNYTTANPAPLIYGDGNISFPGDTEFYREIIDKEDPDLPTPPTPQQLSEGEAQRSIGWDIATGIPAFGKLIPKAVKSIPWVGNSVSGIATGIDLGKAAYHTLSGDSAAATRDLKDASLDAMGTLPIAGNLLSAEEAVWDYRALNKRKQGVSSEEAPLFSDVWAKELSMEPGGLFPNPFKYPEEWYPQGPTQ